MELLYVLGALAGRVLGDRKVLDRFLGEIEAMGENRFFELIRERGRKEGLSEGARMEALRALRRILARRFGKVERDLLSRLEAIPRVKDLEELLEEAAVAPTLKDFRKKALRAASESDKRRSLSGTGRPVSGNGPAPRKP